MTTGIDALAYPLYWPEQWPRTPYRTRTSRYKVSFAEARDRALHSLSLLGVRRADVIISSNIPLRADGLPRADINPPDPGVAVYWSERNKPRVIACDAWATVAANMRACGLAIEALRALKRSGATQVVERAYAGFAALPAQAGSTGRPWRAVLFDNETMPITITRDMIIGAYRRRVLSAHPDVGGSDDALRELVRARDEALREVTT